VIPVISPAGGSLAVETAISESSVETTAQGLTFRVDKTTAMDNPWDCVDLFQ
jgi:hypothetical protein